MHVENPLRALYKNYLLFTIHFKVCIIELFWLVNFANIIQSERSLHILSEMIWSIDRPILLASYFLIVQSEELLLLKPVIFTKKLHGQQPWCSIYQPTDLLGIILCSTAILEWFLRQKWNKTVKRKHDSNSDDDSADPNNNVTIVSEPVPTPAKKPKWPRKL